MARLLLAGLVLALFACTQEEPPAYLDETIPPCTPVDGAGVDPCPSGGMYPGVPSVARGGSLDRGDAPMPVSKMLGDGSRIWGAIHVVVRATFLPNTNRCTTGDLSRFADHLADALDEAAGAPAYKCYLDMRANEYYVGTGPTTLTVLLWREGYPKNSDPDEEIRLWLQEALGGAAGYEIVAFLAPTWDVSSESWRLIGFWGIQQNDDVSITALHPAWRLWEGADRQQHIALLEMTLPDLDTALDAAHASRIASFGGRIGAAEDLPMLITDANNLRIYYEEVGAYDDEDNPPGMPPPPCGKAVPDQANNPGLMRDCKVLLAAKDALRGTGTLNWSVQTAIGSWDGMTVAGTPKRVTKLELANKSLTGSVPAALAKLELTTLKLTGNRLTGCIPVALREVAENDLDNLGLPDCAR